MRIFVRALLLGAALVACQPASDATGQTISNAALAERIKSGTAPVILDVRTPDEYRAGHIPGAINIPIDQLPTRLSEIPIAKSDEVVVHCERGPRAARAEAILSKDGYAHVVDLEGHMKGWRESGLPVE